MTNHNGNHKSKERLQQEVEAKRDQIVNTVDEIRNTLTEEIRDRKEAVKDAMDWRFYVRKQPVLAVGGAVALGAIVGKIVTQKILDASHELDWTERISDYSRVAGRKFDEFAGRAQGEPKWKARSRSMMSSGSDLLFRELAKAAQRMIIPTVVAAVTGKMASDNKTTVVKQHVHKAPGGRTVSKSTTDVEEFDDDGNRIS